MFVSNVSKMSPTKNFSQVLPRSVSVHEPKDSVRPAVIKDNGRFNDQNVTNTVKYQDFFKCPRCINSGHYTTDEFKKLLDHMSNEHHGSKFLCLYCNKKTDQIKPEDYMDGQKLVRHLISVHSQRRYQCNLCLYRSISPEHVNIHQKNIHPDIYARSLQNRQVDGKWCRIIECPPPTRNTSPRQPSPLQQYNTHRHLRINNEGTNGRNFQCVYCDFLNESLDEVLYHCVSTHPDYHILYYNPDTTVEQSTVTTSDLSHRTQQLTDFDIFGTTNDETQDSRVSSTEPPKEFESVKAIDKNNENCKAYVDAMAFKKKDRVSAVQTIAQQRIAGMSSTTLNKEDRVFKYGKRPGPASKARQLAIAVNRPSSKPKFNQPIRTNGLLSANLRKDQEKIKESVNQKKRTYESESEDDQNKPPIKKFVRTHKPVPKIDNKLDNKIGKSESTPKVIKKKIELHLLSDDEQEELEKETLGHMDRHSKLTEKKKTETNNKFNQLRKSRKEKNLNAKQEEKKISNSIRKRYMSTDSDRSGNKSLEVYSSDDDVVSPKPGTSKTTIARATPERDSDSSDQSPLYICFFCDDTFTDRKKAMCHHDSHFPDLEEPEEIHTVNHWVKRFLKCQFDGKLFEAEEEFNNKPHYRCPICVRIGRHKSVTPKNFRQLWEAKAHLLEHSCWTPIKCLTAKTDDSEEDCGTKLPNNDHLIAKHLNKEHHEALNNSDNEFICSLIGDQAKNGFPEHTRDALIIDGYIYHETSKGQAIEKQIDKLIELMVKDRERKLRSYAESQYIIEKNSAIKVSLPKVVIKKLPRLNFSDNDMIHQFLLDEEAKSQSQQKPKQCSSRKQSNVETVDISSSSDESDSEDMKYYICHYCNEKFIIQYDIKRHIESSHPKQTIRYHRG